MTYTIEENLENFHAWAGGKATLDVLIEKDDCEKVEEFIEQCFSHPSDTDINDFLWFERDQIAEYLGYDDWDAYENNEVYKDINGVELAVSDEVHWDDEAGWEEDENGHRHQIRFVIVEENGDGYFNLAYADEEDENPERWAYHTELEIV